MNPTTSTSQIHAPIPALEIHQHRDLFPTGRWTITPAAIVVLAHHHVDPADIIWRHRTGDWGDVELERALANNEAVEFGGAIRSTYQFGADVVNVETVFAGVASAILQ